MRFPALGSPRRTLPTVSRSPALAPATPQVTYNYPSQITHNGKGGDYTVEGSTFVFNFECDGGACSCGQFVNGDFWVASPSGGKVKVTDVPAPPSRNATGFPINGLVLNPSGDDYGQGINPCYGSDHGSAVGPLLGYKEELNLVGKNVQLPLEVATPSTLLRALQIGDTPFHRCGGHLWGCCIHSTATLSILAAVPAKAGARSLRPAFAAGDQTVYDVDASFDFSRLPSYENITKAISQWPDDGKSIAPLTYQQIVDRYRMPFYDLCASNWSKGGGCGSGGAYEAFVPQLSAAMARNGSSIGGADTYGASIGRDIQEAILYVMNDAEMARTPQKAAAVYALLQRGIDYFGQKQSSPLARWPAAAGQNGGRKYPLLFFAALATDDAINATVRGYTPFDFQETGDIVNQNADGHVLWGDPSHEQTSSEYEDRYWNGVIFRSCFNGADQSVFKCTHEQVHGAADPGGGCAHDPYHQIDGPSTYPGGGYAHETWFAKAGFSFIMGLFPHMRSVEAYADRVDEFAATHKGRGACHASRGDWLHASFGAITGPDSCAPPTVDDQRAGCLPSTDPSKCSDYKVKWGPDPNNPGKCIGHGGDPLKDGRFSNCAGDQHPLDSPSYLWAVLNKCDAAMAPPPSPPDLLCGFPQ